MGPTHAMSGAAAGLLAAAVIPAVSTVPAGSFVFAGVCAGAALLPDLDCPTSSVARAFGPASQVLSTAVARVSCLLYRATATRRDGHRDGGHRTATHTAVFAVAAGAAAGSATGWGGRPAVAVLLFVMLALALRGLLHTWATRRGWIAVAAVAAAMTWAAGRFLPPTGAGWLGAAVALGVLVHLAGDVITREGCPVLAPLPVGGRVWFDWRLPSPLRIRAGGVVEYAVLLPACTAATVLLTLRTANPALLGWLT